MQLIFLIYEKKFNKIWLCMIRKLVETKLILEYVIISSEGRENLIEAAVPCY